MKKRSLITKLALSGVALAATAATLATSTYAWYTTNTNVSANGMSATTASTGASSVLISTDDENWSQSVTLDTSSVKNLAPIQCVAAGSFVELNGTAASEAYLDVKLFVKTTATGGDGAVPLYLNDVTISNSVKTTPAKGTADNYLKNVAGNIGGVDSAQSKYWVDVTKAVWMNFTSSSVTKANETIYDLATCGERVASLNVTDANANALDYLNRVLNQDESVITYTKGKTGKTTTDLSLAKENAIVASSTESTTALQVAALDANGQSTELHFRFFLNGWDEFCFDACKGQTFNVTLSFTTDDEAVLKKVKTN